MNISEFRGVYTRLHARFEEKGQELREFNRAKCQQLGTEVFDILQKLPVDCVELPTSGEVDDAFQSALNKM